MSHYRKIDVRIWNDAKFTRFSDDGKLLFFRILTHQNMTPLGGMKLSIGALSDEAAWKSERFRKALSELMNAGIVMVDTSVHMFGLPNFVRYNPPESPNVVKSWGKTFDLLPECELRSLLARRAMASIEDKTEAFHKALPKAFLEAFPKAKGQAFPKSMANSESEREGELKEEGLPGGGSPTTVGGCSAGDPPDTGKPTLRAIDGGSR